MIFTRLILKQR